MNNLSAEEKKIIEKIINKDERTLFNFYNQNIKIILNFINKQINNRQVSEEISQDVFFDFIENLRDFRGESSLKTFLFAIAKNKVIDYIRKKKIKKILFSKLPKYFIENAASIVLDDDIARIELSNKIKKVLNKLPNDYRLIIRLKYEEEVKVKDIARRLVMSYKGAESLLFRARKAFIRLFKSLP